MIVVTYAPTEPEQKSLQTELFVQVLGSSLSCRSMLFVKSERWEGKIPILFLTPYDVIQMLGRNIYLSPNYILILTSPLESSHTNRHMKNLLLS